MGGRDFIFSSAGAPAFVMDGDRGRRAGSHAELCDYSRAPVMYGGFTSNAVDAQAPAPFLFRAAVVGMTMPVRSAACVPP